MDPQKTQTLLTAWRATLSEKEKALHDLAAVKLKKSLDFPGDRDNGSYFPEKCHAFRKWLKAQKA